jgi:hypothetical protein
MYDNGKIRLVEIVLRRGGEGGSKEKDGEGKSKIYRKHFANVTAYPQYSYNMLMNK